MDAARCRSWLALAAGAAMAAGLACHHERDAAPADGGGPPLSDANAPDGSAPSPDAADGADADSDAVDWTTASDAAAGCHEGAIACLGNTTVTCGDAGAWAEGTFCAGATPSCLAGACASPAAVAAGGTHTCALRDDGSVSCWGDNAIGQLGLAVPAYLTAPGASVPLSARAISLTASALHACAVLESGHVACWGENGAGQLGTGDKLPRAAPTELDVPRVIAAATGSAHTCVLVRGGFVECWGANTRGEVGVNDGAPHLAPVDVVLTTDSIVALAAGDQRTVALDLDGHIVTWGALGAFVSVDSTGPVKPAPTAFAIAASFQACAVLESGQVACWGAAPGALPTLPARAVAVAVGRSSTCAVLETGDLSCWGDNYAGQLGLGHTRSQPTPSAPISVGGRAVAVTLGYRHTCVLLEDRSIKCWGDNSSGQLGLGDRRARGGTPDTVPARLPPVAFP